MALDQLPRRRDVSGSASIEQKFVIMACLIEQDDPSSPV
jgi:hypothetical protein